MKVLCHSAAPICEGEMQKFLSNDSTILAELIEKYSVQGWRVAPGTLIGTLSPNRYRPGEMEIVYACIMEKEDEA